jgi:hypothetical protein
MLENRLFQNTEMEWRNSTAPQIQAKHYQGDMTILLMPSGSIKEWASKTAMNIEIVFLV